MTGPSAEKRRQWRKLAELISDGDDEDILAGEAIGSLLAGLEAAERERDEQHKAWNKASWERDEAQAKLKHCLTAGETTARLAEEAKAEAGRLREALAPFAQYALVTDEYTSGYTAPDEGEVLVARSATLNKTIRIGDFRKARAALEPRRA